MDYVFGKHSSDFDIYSFDVNHEPGASRCKLVVKQNLMHKVRYNITAHVLGLIMKQSRDQIKILDFKGKEGLEPTNLSRCHRNLLTYYNTNVSSLSVFFFSVFPRCSRESF